MKQLKIIKNNQRYQDPFKLIRVGNFWNNNYVEYESSNNRNKNLSVKEYFDKN